MLSLNFKKKKLTLPSPRPTCAPGAEHEAVVRVNARAAVRELCVPLPGGARRLAALRHDVTTTADLCLRHKHLVAERHQQ